MKNLTKIAQHLRAASDEVAKAAAEAAKPEEQERLLFSVADLETALKELHYGQAHEIASRVTKSLVPEPGYTDEELARAYKNLHGSFGKDGLSWETWWKQMKDQVHQNRISDNVKGS